MGNKGRSGTGRSSHGIWRSQQVGRAFVDDGIDEAKRFAISAEEDVFVVEILNEQILRREVVVVITKAERADAGHVGLHLGAGGSRGISVSRYQGRDSLLPDDHREGTAVFDEPAEGVGRVRE